nr:hypothetical protein [uncultured Trichococcus sp.]
MLNLTEQTKKYEEQIDILEPSCYKKVFLFQKNLKRTMMAITQEQFEKVRKNGNGKRPDKPRLRCVITSRNKRMELQQRLDLEQVQVDKMLELMDQF